MDACSVSGVSADAKSQALHILLLPNMSSRQLITNFDHVTQNCSGLKRFSTSISDFFLMDDAKSETQHI